MLKYSTCGAPLKRSLVFHRAQRRDPVSYIWMGITETSYEFRPELGPHGIMIVEYPGFPELLFVVPFCVKLMVERAVMGKRQRSPGNSHFEHGESQSGLVVYAYRKISRR